MKIDTCQAPALTQQQPRRSLLIVDDEEVIRNLCVQALEGYRVLQAGDGREALDLLAREDVDLVLTDVMLPGLNGLDLLRECKQLAPNRAVVMMTGFGDRETILRSLKLGADDFISKPINLLQLRTIIAHALEKMSLREELLELKKLDRLKSDFLGLVSHKLKTPVTVISLFIQNLARDLDSGNGSEGLKNLALIQEESNYLASLIQDLLRYSERILPSRPQSRQPTDLKSLAVSALAEIREAARRQRLEIHQDLPDDLPALTIDPTQISFCLEALLDNAVKFTPAGGRICIAAATGHEWIRIKISDSGPGIPAQLQDRVFEKFFQIDPERTGQVRGFGLGLYYAREFARAHGGRLDLESLPGHGAEFVLQLPLASPTIPA